MLLKDHYWKVLLELMKLFGIMVFIMVTILQLSGSTTVTLKSLWALALLAGAIGFRFVSLVNFHKLDDHTMRINYLLSSVLADITLIILLGKFAPGGKQFIGKGWLFIGIYIVLKGTFYIAMHLQTLNTARKINAALMKR